ncbi:MAG: hypothetical protein OXC12_04845 [Spirochaetaceae bacterium]|nr:hypothetical protein [Spirochaetaceae bacterium]
MNNAVGRWLKVGVLLMVVVALAACQGAAGAPGEPGPPGPPGPTPTTPTPEPTEPPAEQPPATVGTIAAVTVAVGATHMVDVAANFSEPEGEALTYSADSDDTAAATVSVSGSVVSVTGVADGTATITVTATDTDSLSARQTISVTVGAGDVVDESGDCATLDVGGTCKVTAAAENSVKSGNTNLLTVTKKDGYWEVLAIAKGTTTVEVRNTATNALVETIDVHINNQAPTRTDKTHGLAQLMFDSGGEADYPDDDIAASPAKPLYKIVVDKTATADALNLDEFFTDADGDDVTFSAKSSHPDRAIVVGYIEVANGTTEVLVDVLHNTGDEVTFTFSATDDDSDDPKVSADDNSLLLRVELKPVLSWEYSVGQYDAPQFFNFHNPNDVDYRRNNPLNFNETDDTRDGWHQLVFSGDVDNVAGFKFAGHVSGDANDSTDPAQDGEAGESASTTAAAHMDMCDADEFTSPNTGPETDNGSCYEVTSSDPTIVEIGDLDYNDGTGGDEFATHTINFQALKSGSVTITVTYKAWNNRTPPGLFEDSKDLSVRVSVVDEP